MIGNAWHGNSWYDVGKVPSYKKWERLDTEGGCELGKRWVTDVERWKRLGILKQYSGFLFTMQTSGGLGGKTHSYI